LLFFFFAFAAVGIALVAASMGTNTFTVQKIIKSSPSECMIERTYGTFECSQQFGELCFDKADEKLNLFDGEKLDINSGYIYAMLASEFAFFIPSLIALAVAIYNLFSKPYQTFADVTAFTVYFSVTIGFGVLAIIMGVVLLVVEYPSSLPETGSGITSESGYEITSTTPGLSLWLLSGAVASAVAGFITSFVAKADAKKIREKNEFIEGPKGNDNDIFSL